MKIPLSQAHLWLPGVSRSKTYADEAAGVLTATKDPTRGNHKHVDIAELQRVYPTVRDPQERPKDSELDDTGQTQLLIESLENRIADLTKQLDLSSDRETVLTAEKTKLLDMLALEQEKTRLMLPGAKTGWIRRVLGLGTT